MPARSARRTVIVRGGNGCLSIQASRRNMSSMATVIGSVATAPASDPASRFQVSDFIRESPRPLALVRAPPLRLPFGRRHAAGFHDLLEASQVLANLRLGIL